MLTGSCRSPSFCSANPLAPSSRFVHRCGADTYFSQHPLHHCLQNEMDVLQLHQEGRQLLGWNRVMSRNHHQTQRGELCRLCRHTLAPADAASRHVHSAGHPSSPPAAPTVLQEKERGTGHVGAHVGEEGLRRNFDCGGSDARMAVRSKYWFSGMRRRSGQQRAASVRAAAGEYQAPWIRCTEVLRLVTSH